MRYTTFIVLFFMVSLAASAQSTVIDSLLQVLAKHPRDTNEIRTLDRLGSEFMRRDIEKAKAYAYQQITLAKALGTDFGLSSAYSGLVAMHQNSGRIDSALYYLSLLEALAKNFSADKKASVNYANSAGLFYKNQGRLREALPYLLEALRLIGVEGDKTSRAGQMLNVGNTYYQLGDFKNAADYHLQSLRLFEEVKNKRGQSFCFQGLGNDFLGLGQYAVAEKYLLQSEKIKTSLGDKRGELTAWMSLGSVYQQWNKPDLAMVYFIKALTRSRELKFTIEESNALFNLGSLFKTMKKNEESRNRFSEALILARQSGDSALVSRIKTYQVALQNDLQKEAKEEETLLENIKISLEAGALDNTAEGHFELAKWYESRKQFEKAYENLKLGQQLNDSIKGNEVVLQLRRLEEEYKGDKKEQEIALLKKDQELQSLALSRQKVLIASIAIALIAVVVIGFLLINRYRVMNRIKRHLELEQMRQTISRDLHDDIGSALSSINILSKVAQEEKDSTQNYLQRIGDQSAKMMETMGDMVWSINPQNDSLEQVIVRMREFATEILDAQNIALEFTDNIPVNLVLDAEKRRNLFLIFKEVVNNAAKYSQATLLKVSFSQFNNSLHLHVSDNGKGFDEATVKAGNGLRNLRERGRATGTLHLKSGVGKGTVVEFQLPLG